MEPVRLWPGRNCRMVASDHMAEANEQDQIEQEQKRPLTLRSGGGTLGLRRPAETGQVRQSFSHGRSKQVTVEVRKKRIIGPGSAPEPTHVEPGAAVARAQPAAPEPTAAPRPEPARRPTGVPRQLTAEETAARVRAVQDAAKADVEA